VTRKLLGQNEVVDSKIFGAEEASRTYKPVYTLMNVFNLSIARVSDSKADQQTPSQAV
jgi:hypothetical protein